MCSRVICLVALVMCVCVCVYVAKKSTCLVRYHLKKSCCVYYTTWLWNLNASKVFSMSNYVYLYYKFNLISQIPLKIKAWLLLSTAPAAFPDTTFSLYILQNFHSNSSYLSWSIRLWNSLLESIKSILSLCPQCSKWNWIKSFYNSICMHVFCGTI